jgi:hypothetical protein
MSEHFNGLTPAQAERLAMLAEECGEVIQIIGKILRHGYDSYHPDRPHITNRELLQRELTDLAAVENQIHAQDRVFLPSSLDVDAAWAKKLRYAHHQEELPKGDSHE